ncbi:MAG: thermonuclease family protein [Anaerolineae bacterium]|nr:thermonuclease family protein [Anaerolineae bacterium]
MLDDNLYHYRAVVRSVYDGDTCTVDIDLGLHSWVHGEKVRLARINAPELRGEVKVSGQVSRDFLRSQIDGKEIRIQTIKDRKGKYGRYLAEIWLNSENNGWININDLMVNAGQAVYQDY